MRKMASERCGERNKASEQRFSGAAGTFVSRNGSALYSGEMSGTAAEAGALAIGCLRIN